MGDVDGDQILDLVAGTGAGADAEVVAYAGSDTTDGAVHRPSSPASPRSTPASPAG